MVDIFINLLLNFKIHILPIINDSWDFILIIFLVILINMVSLNIYIYQAFYLYIYLGFIFFIFLLFGYNQYIGFLLVIELTAITFIIAVIAEFNFSLILENKVYNFYTLLPVLVTSIFINYHFFYKFNYYFYYYNYYKNCLNTINNDIAGLYNLIFKDLNMYIIILSLTFIIFTFILIFFFFNYIVPVTFKKTNSFLYYILRYLKNKKYQKNNYIWESVLNYKVTKFR